MKCIVFLFFIYFYILIILLKVKHVFNYGSEINITIKGTGKQQILSSSGCSSGYSNGIFNSLPDEILVNGILQSSPKRYVVDN